VTVLGPTGAGKTTLLIELAEARPYTIFIATKTRDPLIGDLQRRGWRVLYGLRDLRALRYVDGKLVPADRHLVFWPSTAGSIRERRSTQGEQIRGALDQVFASGGWTVAADETLWLAQELRLEPELRALWHQGRSAGLTLLAATQRPAWVPRAAYSQASYLFMFSTSDAADLKRLSDIGGGVDTRRLGREVQRLGRYEFAAVAPRERPPVLVRSKVNRR
jgi:DNA helicase HerA-like ATPase